eukprot:11626972-Karenia_brevis.AAC.1
MAYDPELEAGPALFGMLLTQIHLVIRFHQYLEYPTALSKLTKKFNPGNYEAEILVFLNLPAAKLDAGYSLPLQHDAWRAAHGVEADAAGYILADDRQQELVGIVRFGDGCTLDAERKNNLDKQSEGRRI